MNTRTVTVKRDFYTADGAGPVSVEITATVMGQRRNGPLSQGAVREVVDFKAREITDPDGPTIPAQILELFWPRWQEDVLAEDWRLGDMAWRQSRPVGSIHLTITKDVETGEEGFVRSIEVSARIAGQYRPATLEDPPQYPEVVDHRAREITDPDGPTIPAQILELFWPRWQEEVLEEAARQADEDDDEAWERYLDELDYQDH